MKGSKQNRCALFCGVGIFLFLFITLSSFVLLRSFKFDLTEYNRFSLSDEAKIVAKELQEPIVLELYYSEYLGRNIGAFALFADRVKQLLQSLAQKSDQHIQLKIYNPEPFSEAEDFAIEHGMQGVPLDQGGQAVYFGLVAKDTKGNISRIPFLQIEREPFLEYDVVKMIYNLAHPEKPKIAIISSLPIMGGAINPQAPQAPQPPWMVITQLQEFFEVIALETSKEAAETAEIPEDIDVLMLIQPEKLSEAWAYAIDQFVLAGKRLILLTDPLSEIMRSQSPGLAQPETPLTGLEPLLKTWGVSLPLNQIVGDLNAAERINANSGSQMMPAAYLAWLNYQKPYLNPDDPVTGPLGLIKFASAGYIELEKNSPLQLTPLVSSSIKSQAIDADKVRFVNDPIQLLQEFEPENKSFTIAARLYGTVNTAFPEKAKIKTSQEPVNMVIIQDTDFLYDAFWLQTQEFFGERVIVPFASNGNFIINIVDHFSGSHALMNLRARGHSDRPFTRIQELERSAGQAFFNKEQSLKQKLLEAETKIRELEKSETDTQSLGLTPAQQEELEHFREEIVTTRKELRRVQASLREDILSLQATLKFLNIVFVPLFVAGLSFMLWYQLKRRRKNAK